MPCFFANLGVYRARQAEPLAVCVNIRVFFGKNYAVALIYVRMHVKLLCKGEKLLYHPWVKLGCIKGFARNGIVYYRAAVVYYRPLHAHGLPYIGRAVEAAAQRRLYALQIIQPGLAGLMDGSVSTLAPVFAAAAATHDSWQAFLVGLAASLGAGISMGFAEALSDDGSVTGRGHPWVRGLVCGLMTTLGGIGHTLPFLIGNYRAALMAALVVVALELAAITWVRSRFMNTPIVSAALQVVLGGVLVFLTGLLIGNA